MGYRGGKSLMSKHKKYNYQSHDEVPEILYGYMDSIVDVEFPVRAIEIEDINKFLNFIDEGPGLPDEELDIPDPRQMALDI
jgi:hypothetical protein